MLFCSSGLKTAPRTAAGLVHEAFGEPTAGGAPSATSAERGWRWNRGSARLRKFQFACDVNQTNPNVTPTVRTNVQALMTGEPQQSLSILDTLASPAAPFLLLARWC